MRLSARGYFIIIHPCFLSFDKWCVVSCDKNGNWHSGSVHDTKEEAQKRRSDLFKLHRKLKAETDARAKKRRKR